MTDKTDALVAEVDALLETQGRLMFARKNYNEAQAEAFGVRLLDFMRLHGEKVRAALAAPAEGGQGEVRLWDSQWVNIVNHPEVLNAEDQETAVSVAVRMTETAIAKNVADGKLPPVTRKLIDSAGGAKGEDDQGWDAHAEQATAEALGVGGANPNATSVDDLFTTQQPAEGDGAVLVGYTTPAIIERALAQGRSPGLWLKSEGDEVPVYAYTRPAATAQVPDEVRALPERWRTKKRNLSALGCANELALALAAPAAPKGAVVDEAMVERAFNAWCDVADVDEWRVRNTPEALRAALAAALATGEQP